MKRWMLFLSLCLTISAGCGATPRSVPPTPTQWFPPRLTPSPTPSPTDTPHPSPLSTPAQMPGVIAPSMRYKGWNQYTNSVYDFSFSFPPDWTLEEAGHFVHLRYQTLALSIGFKRSSENIHIVRTGVAAGDLVTKGSISFLGTCQLSRDVLVYEGKEKALLYNSAGEIKVGDLIFTLSLDFFVQRDYSALGLGSDVQAQADKIVESFQLTNPPDIAPGTNIVVDCAAVYPGLPGCLRQESLVGGRLAFVDERPPFDNRPTVIDLEHGGAWTLGKYQGNPMGWSPSGEYLLQLEYAGEGRSSYRVYRFDGMLVGEWSSLPTASFWAPPDAFTGARDWLAAPTSDGALLAVSQPRGQQRQVLPPGSLSTDERDIVRWSRDGWLAWSPTYDHLVAARQWEQQLFVHLADGGRQPLVWRLSEDFSKTYYQILDWVPGTRLILAAKGMACNSCWTWGVPLVAINADTGKVTELSASMLLTPEAYAWHPARPGLLALAEGGSRYLHDPRRLVLLDVTTGKFDYLTDQDTSVFEPTWSPDGKLLAYAAVRASPNASGDGQTLERLLNGRAIYIADPQSGKIRKLTQPPDDAVDGWPQWSADGKQFLYTRQRDDVTDVRVVTLDGSHDELLVTGLARPMCYYGGCGWSRMLAYYPGSEAKR